MRLSSKLRKFADDIFGRKLPNAQYTQLLAHFRGTRPLRLRLLHGYWEGVFGRGPEGEGGRAGALHGN